jgi:hypothetical protein
VSTVAVVIVASNAYCSPLVQPHSCAVCRISTWKTPRRAGYARGEVVDPGPDLTTGTRPGAMPACSRPRDRSSHRQQRMIDMYWLHTVQQVCTVRLRLRSTWLVHYSR